jgi:hypothetical protein
MTDYDELEERWLQRLNSLSETAQENGEYVLGAVVLAVFGIWSGVLDPDWPAWWPIIPIMGVAALIAGYFGAERIYELIPEEDGILLVSLRGDEPGGEIWEIYEDDFEDMAVDGTLYQWDESPRRVYEVRDYYPNEHRAVGNWREAEPASAILEERTTEDAIAFISELRETYEPEAARARRLQRRLRGIVRTLDRERTQARARQLDDATGLESIDSKAISDVLDEELPDDLHPEAGGGSEDSNPEAKMNGDSDRVDVTLDDVEPLDPEYDPEEVGI